MMNNLAAQLETTFYVFGQRLAARSEKGQTTAEYVGIVAFVAALVIVLIGMKTTFGNDVKGIIEQAFTNIKSAMG